MGDSFIDSTGVGCLPAVLVLEPLVICCEPSGTMSGSGCKATGGDMNKAFPFMANKSRDKSKDNQLNAIKKKMFDEMVTKRLEAAKKRTEVDKQESLMLSTDAAAHRERLDREREELKRMRVSRRAPNAPIASSDEEGDGELLDALGKGGLYDGSTQAKKSKKEKKRKRDESSSSSSDTDSSDERKKSKKEKSKKKKEKKKKKKKKSKKKKER